MLGHSVEEFQAQPQLWIEALDPEDRAALPQKSRELPLPERHSIRMDPVFSRDLPGRLLSAQRFENHLEL